MSIGPRGIAGASCIYQADVDWLPVMKGEPPYENPNDYWAVGYAADVAGLPHNFVYFSKSEVLYGPSQTLNCLTSGRPDSFGDVPNFCQNVGNTTFKGVEPGQIALTPYIGAYSYSILRWVAARSGLYDVNSWFYAGDAGTTLASIYVDGTLLINLNITPANYSTRISLDRGSILDFVVGPGDDPFSDITPLNVLIKDTRCLGYTGYVLLREVIDP